MELKMRESVVVDQGVGCDCCCGGRRCGDASCRDGGAVAELRASGDSFAAAAG